MALLNLFGPQISRQRRGVEGDTSYKPSLIVETLKPCVACIVPDHDRKKSTKHPVDALANSNKVVQEPPFDSNQVAEEAINKSETDLKDIVGTEEEQVQIEPKEDHDALEDVIIDEFFRKDCT